MANDFNPMQRVEKVKLDRINANADFFFKELVVKPRDDIAVLPENIFVNYFLPFFCGERKMDEYKDNILAQWISIAGSPTAQVNIIKPDTNTFLFTVPGLVDTNFIDINNTNKSQPLNHIFTNYELHKNQLPILGHKYLANALEDKMKQIAVKDDNVKKDVSLHQQQWLDIFVRYGKVKDNTQNDTKTNDVIRDDEMSFED